MHRHKLEYRAVRWRHFRERATTDEQRDVAGADLLVGDEGQDAFGFAEVHAVVLQNTPGGGEELARGDGLGEAQGDEVRLLRQPGGQGERHAQAFGEHLVDERDQGHIMEAHGDGRAGEVLAQTVRDTLGDSALDDDARGRGDGRAFLLGSGGGALVGLCRERPRGADGVREGVYFQRGAGRQEKRDGERRGLGQSAGSRAVGGINDIRVGAGALGRVALSNAKRHRKLRPPKPVAHCTRYGAVLLS